MKRIIAVVLIAVLLFITAFAETDKEITFRGMPWGMDIESALRFIVGDDVNIYDDTEKGNLVQDLKEKEIIAWFGYRDFLNEVDSFDESLHADNCVYTGGIYYVEPLRVAGLDVVSVMINAIQKTENGIQLAGSENTFVYEAIYQLYNLDSDSLDSLYEKLVYLYGKEDEQEYCKFRWYGQNNTILEYYAEGIPYIKYRTNDVNDYIIAWNNSVAANTEILDVDGL